MTGKDKNQSEQSGRFIETARALGCDEDTEAFREKLRVIARQKSKPAPEPPRRATRKPKQ